MSGVDETVTDRPETAPGALSQADAPTGQESPLALGSGARFALEEIARPLAIAGMLTCVAVALAQLIVQIAPQWPAGFFSVLTFLVCLESIQAQRILSRRNVLARDKFRFRFVEWVVILMVTRFGAYLKYGVARLAADVALWSGNPLTFFETGFLVNSILLVMFWSLASMLSRTMQELEASPIEKMPSITDPGHYLRSTMPRHGRTDRQSRLNSIVTIFFAGGVLLLLLSGFSRVDVRDMVLLQHPRSSGVIFNALIYFILGFLLISQAQYTILRANWELQDIPILGKLGRRWVLLVLGFLVAIGLVSALLPVNYSVGLIDTLSTIIRWIIYAVVQIAFLFLFVISFLVGQLMRLFTGNQQGETPPPMRQATPPPAPAGLEGGGPPSWWQLVRSLIFWAIFVGVIGYSLFYFARDRWGLFRNLSVSRFWRWLTGLWQQLGQGTQRALNALQQELARRRAERRARAAARGWRFLSLRRLSPRDRVRYFYVSILRRSAELGFGRPPAWTPLEYEEVLRAHVPEEQEEVHGLTQAFLEARYSEHQVDKERSDLVQAIWRRVRAAVRRYGRRAAGADHDAPGA